VADQLGFNPSIVPGAGISGSHDVTMRIALRQLIETEDNLEPGEIAGEIIIDGEAETVQVHDPALRNRIEALLREGLVAYGGDPSGIRMATAARKVRPGDPAYLGALRERLEQKDFRLQPEVQ
jgi:hypothetical protein